MEELAFFSAVNRCAETRSSQVAEINLFPGCAGRGEAIKANSKGDRFYLTGSNRGNYLLLLRDLSNSWKLHPVDYSLCHGT